MSNKWKFLNVIRFKIDAKEVIFFLCNSEQLNKSGWILRICKIYFYILYPWLFPTSPETVIRCITASRELIRPTKNEAFQLYDSGDNFVHYLLH